MNSRRLANSAPPKSPPQHRTERRCAFRQNTPTNASYGLKSRLRSATAPSFPISATPTDRLHVISLTTGLSSNMSLLFGWRKVDGLLPSARRQKGVSFVQNRRNRRQGGEIREDELASLTVREVREALRHSRHPRHRHRDSRPNPFRHRSRIREESGVRKRRIGLWLWGAASRIDAKFDAPFDGMARVVSIDAFHWWRRPISAP